MLKVAEVGTEVAVDPILPVFSTNITCNHLKHHLEIDVCQIGELSQAKRSRNGSEPLHSHSHNRIPKVTVARTQVVKLCYITGFLQFSISSVGRFGLGRGQQPISRG